MKIHYLQSGFVGMTSVPAANREAVMTYSFGRVPEGSTLTPDNLSDTHIMVYWDDAALDKSDPESALEALFVRFQGEFMDDYTLANLADDRPHTSMSAGDVVEDANGDLWIVKGVGWQKVFEAESK
jgi:hypothetical protein